MRGDQPPQRVEPTKDAVIVSMPNAIAAPKSEISIPLRIDNLAGASVSSYQFDLEYDPAVITPTQQPVVTTETLSENLAAVYNSPKPGLLKIVVYGALPTGGDGVYVDLRFAVIGASGTSSPLSISKFRLNDGNVETALVNGKLSVSHSSNGPVLTGRLVTSAGRPVFGVPVSITDTGGLSRSTISDQLGLFEFGNLSLGETYSERVQSKDFRFYPTSISIFENLTSLDMIADQ
jgi:hypothetical protein